MAELATSVDTPPDVDIEARGDAVLVPEISELWRPNFPSADNVHAAAATVPDQPCGAVQEGPSWRVTVSPGKVKIWTKDEADAERTATRQADAHYTEINAMAGWLLEDEEIPTPTPSREITGWTAKSRRNMVERLCDLDYSPLFGDPTRLLAMITLTYPGCWLPVAPNGKAVKKHLQALRKRYRRAFGEDLAAVWKLEFQQRWDARHDERCRCEHCDGVDDGRAPHFHLLMRPPHRYRDGSPCNFKQWLSYTWADVVDHPDPVQRARHEGAGTGVDWNEGLRATDPRRVAVYFTKHGAFQAKEYQHCVPEPWQQPGQGPGRFWGYWVLEPVFATRAVSPEIGTAAGRIVRRYSKAQQVTQQVRRPRARGGVPVSKYPEVIGLAGKELLLSRRLRTRPTRVRAVRARNGRGWLSLNSGPAFATELGAALRQYLDHRDSDLNRAELDRCGLWDTPLARARRLAPGPRRDALIAAFEARECASAAEQDSTKDSLPPVPAPRPDADWLRCSVCGDRLAPALADTGRHVGDCLDTDHRPLLASPRSRTLQDQH